MNNMNNIKNMAEKWLFIIRPSRMDSGAIIHHAIWVDNNTTEEALIEEYEAYVREEFSEEPEAWWMITDKEMKNFLVGDNDDEDTNIYEHGNWVFVDTGYMARAIHMQTRQAFDIESYATLEEMVAKAEELLSEVSE